MAMNQWGSANSNFVTIVGLSSFSMEAQLTAEQAQELEILKRRISGAHNKIPFAERFRDIVATSSRISGSGRFLGVMKSSSGGWWVQSQLLGKFLNLKPNSINKNLRDFGFRRITGTNATAEIRSILPNLALQFRIWSLWKNFVFTFDELTTDATVEMLTAYGCTARHTNSLLQLSSLPQSKSQAPQPPLPASLSPPSTPSTLPAVSTTQWSPSESPEPFLDGEFYFNEDSMGSFFPTE
jgi:hypothetical protein